MPSTPRFRTAEHVSGGHPDKAADQLADAIVDASLNACSTDAERRATRNAIEILIKNDLVVISGETAWSESAQAEIDLGTIVHDVWSHIGYRNTNGQLVIENHIQPQSIEIAVGAGSGVNNGGAGDQGIMVGYACAENAEMLPEEYVKSRCILQTLDRLRRSGQADFLRPDAKAQVTLDSQGCPAAYIVANQHAPTKDGCVTDGGPRCDLTHDDIRRFIFEQAIRPVLGDGLDFRPEKINGTGSFVIGGPTGDAGVVGRKIVVDAYGPRVPVGGGAYSGKDPTKVDRSAAYMARHIAKAIVTQRIGGATEARVELAYGIGQHQPEMVNVLTDRGDATSWVKDRFSDLSPGFIIDYLRLTEPSAAWCFRDTASFGHYGREAFPWELPADV